MNIAPLRLSAAVERRFALGEPHLRTLGATAEPRAAAIRRALAVCKAVDPGLTGPWSREAATRCVRGLMSPGFGAEAALAAAVKEDRPFDPAEVGPLLDGAVARGSMYGFQAEELVLLLEALAGTDVVVEAWVERLEASPALGAELPFKAALSRAGAAITFRMGFLLLRSAAREGFMGRLERLAARGGLGAVELLVRGDDVARREKRLVAAMFVEDRELVASLAQTDDFHDSLTPRFAYLGGAAALATYPRRMRRVPPHLAQRLAVEFGALDDPGVVPVMLELAGKKSAKSAPVDWFRAHQALARPVLEALASGKETAAAARGMLETLDGKPLPTRRRRRATEESLSRELARTLARVRGDEAAEAAAIEAVLERFTEDIGDPQLCKAGHLFAADGTEEGPPALRRPQPTEEEFERWSRLLFAAL